MNANAAIAFGEHVVQLTWDSEDRLATCSLTVTVPAGSDGHATLTLMLEFKAESMEDAKAKALAMVSERYTEALARLSVLAPKHAPGHTPGHKNEKTGEAN